jgi:hypothetical protein
LLLHDLQDPYLINVHMRQLLSCEEIQSNDLEAVIERVVVDVNHGIESASPEDLWSRAKENRRSDGSRITSEERGVVRCL